jgi:hypothetical protein
MPDCPGCARGFHTTADHDEEREPPTYGPAPTPFSMLDKDAPERYRS